MIVCRKAKDLKIFVQKAAADGLRTGFVPTMGALHHGHLSLINHSRTDNRFTVCSIFVNPTQFNNRLDFEKYPHTLEQDINMLELSGCDLLFLPSEEEIYPEGCKPMMYDLGFIETVFEGEFRPGHFQGVCMVVHRLLDIVKPDAMYVGQKDYQQCMVIQKLIDITGIKTELVICDTLREEDGLAMSSRNLRLSPEQRKTVPAIHKELLELKSRLKKGPVNELAESSFAKLESLGFKVDYFAIADARTLEPVSNWNGDLKLVALVAAYIGEIRLIDNLPLN